MSRHRIQLGLSAFAGAALAGSCALAADTYALIVGIDDYVGTVNDLQGAVNDAKDITSVLLKTGAKVTTLIDAAADKASIERNWFELIGKAQAGDTFVFSYSGHGDQEPEPPGRNGEQDGKNENFILGGYEPTGPAIAERIVDDEVFAWLTAADEKGIEVVFLADSCHSGTMYRSLAGDQPRYRTGTFRDPDLANDVLALPAPVFATASDTDFEHVTFIGATQESKLTPELTIDGQQRGALSWAFARAIEGAADQNGDGTLDDQELLAYLVPTVQTQSESQQIPSVLPIRPDKRLLLRSIVQPDSPLVDAPPVGPADPVALLTLFVRGDKSSLPQIPGVNMVDDASKADLVWDRQAGTVDHRIGGRVAEAAGEDDIAAILSKWAALAVIKKLAAADPIELSLPSGNQTYVSGDIVQVEMTGARHPYLTMFNLPPDGRVEFFIPANDREALTDWRDKPFREKFRPDKPPFGAEHLVAILTEEPAVALHAALREMPTADRATGLASILSNMLANQKFQAGVIGIYTSGGG